MTPQRFSLLLVAAASALLGQQPQVVTTGLQSPHKIALTPAGNILVTETSVTPNSGRVSIVNAAGTRRSLFEGLPSGTEVTGGGSGPTAMALNGRTLYLAIGGGDIERRGTTPGTSVPNPQGASSPIFSSVLQIEFGTDVDVLTGTFVMTTENQWALADGSEITLSDGAGGSAKIRVLLDLPDCLPDANTIYRFSNPWGLTLSDDKKTLYLNDASTNALVRVDIATGRWARFMRFPPSPNPTPIGPPVIDAVPTNVRYFDNHLLVTFLTGFPFVQGAAQVLSVEPNTGKRVPFIVGLSSAVDIIWRTKTTGETQFFTLEFSQNQSGQPPAPGRLMRYDTPTGEVVTTNLQAAVSLGYNASTKELYILELTGRLLKLQLD